MFDHLYITYLSNAMQGWMSNQINPLSRMIFLQIENTKDCGRKCI